MVLVDRAMQNLVILQVRSVHLPSNNRFRGWGLFDFEQVMHVVVLVHLSLLPVSAQL